MDSIAFKREGNEIRTPGIDFGPQVLVLAEKGNRMLWKAPGHKAWDGNYNPWRHYGTVYMAVEVLADGCAKVVRDEQPGRGWRPIVSELRTWVEGGMGAERKAGA